MQPAPLSPLAVIDLGTNTFHLLIVQPDAQGSFAEIFRERRFVKLAQDGIETIGPDPYARGLAALVHFREVMDTYGVQQYRAFGTAALRTATNGPDFVAVAKEKANISITTIDGNEEARLISQGVLLALPPLGAERILIMDIGGGSVEFILADATGVQWAASFPIGVAVLRQKFHRSEPIVDAEIDTLNNFLERSLAPLFQALQQYPTDHLVGAAGTFDVIVNQMSKGQTSFNSHEIDLNKFGLLYQRCLAANLEERMAMPALPVERADMMVVALLLIDFVLQRASIRQLTVSGYAMKEGILQEMIRDENKH